MKAHDLDKKFDNGQNLRVSHASLAVDSILKRVLAAHDTDVPIGPNKRFSHLGIDSAYWYLVK